MINHLENMYHRGLKNTMSLKYQSYATMEISIIIIIYLSSNIFSIHPHSQPKHEIQRSMVFLPTLALNPH
jgi:hypothetical protein